MRLITDGEVIYEFRLRNSLDPRWEDYFAPCTQITKDGETILTVLVHDQSELFGILLKIRDLGLSLISVKPISQ
jgi:hypothetical protein